MSFSGLFIDAHVHGHRCFEAGTIFKCAANNFSQSRCEMGLSGSMAGCLLLAENPQDEFFDNVRSTAAVDGWRIERTKESSAVFCSRASGNDIDVLVLVAGRQIVVREGLEVLALCCDRRFPGGRSLKATLEEVIRSGALPVLPWGFGKWWFRRGALIRRVLESGFSSRVWLGDNGNRLGGSRLPRYFDVARKRGMDVLPGSDPLPMRGRERDVGKCGFLLQGEVDLRRPASWIKRALRQKRIAGEAVESFGRYESLARFVTSQIAMQLRRRKQTTE